MVIDNYLIFGGVNSSDYGIAISGEGVFNAPERDVELVDIPGRNGAYVLDKGRYRNTTVTYRAFNYEADLEDFRERLSAFRNALGAQKGYQRLTDTFHPDEFRIAAFINGIQFNPIQRNTAAEFDITFNCMPQRYLTSGETAITIGHGTIPGTVKNPTRFESHPMLEVTGYGKIIFLAGSSNRQEIDIISEPIGPTTIHPSVYEIRPSGSSASVEITPDYSSLNTGDEVHINSAMINLTVNGRVISITNFSQTGSSFRRPTSFFNTVSLNIGTADDPFTFNYGTEKTETATFDINYGDIAMVPMTCTISVNTEGIITLSAEASGDRLAQYLFRVINIIGDSTKTALGEPLYLDLDIGEAYKIEDGVKIGVNSGVVLGAKLPTLKPGDNLILFDNTITDLKLIPRWWTI